MNDLTSVIVPSYNSSKTIGLTLDCILRQPSGLIKEIIVVDSSGDEATIRLLEGYKSKGIIVIHLDEKTMPAKARNLGAAAATGRILAFVDSDTCLSDSWLENVIRTYNSGRKVGGGSISCIDFQRNKLLPTAQLFLQLNEFLRFGKPRVVRFSPSCNIFCDRKIFEEIGGFPDIRAAEDLMFGLKVNETDKFWFIPEIEAYHIFREDYQGFKENQKLLGKYSYLYRKTLGNKSIYKDNRALVMVPAFMLIKPIRMIARVLRTGTRNSAKMVLVAPLFFAGLYYWNVGFIKGVLEKN